MQRHLLRVFFLFSLLTGCEQQSWNSPYRQQDQKANTLYGAFSQQPKHLDPARAYSADEYRLIGQIYEPPLQYHYLLRPYQLQGLTAKRVPRPKYFDKQGRRLADDAAVADIAYSEYDIEIKSGIYYQYHPAFAKKEPGGYYYQQLSESELAAKHQLSDFSELGSRELLAADYVYQIKRLADPELHSPLLGLMSKQLVGLDSLAQHLQQAYQQKQHLHSHAPIDLRHFSLPGAQVIDKYTYRLRIYGKDPQFLYWLAMPFFAPMAWEVDHFYQQAGMQAKNLVLDWYPVGTGPYKLIENNPNRQMVLARNENFRGERYPSAGMPGDAQAGYLQRAGQIMPFLDQLVFVLEKESIPLWSKFLQGYYDRSGISSDNFDQAIHLGGGGKSSLSDSLQQQKVRLNTAVAATTIYTGFNMLDSVVGGKSEQAKYLRQAISIAIDMEEYISIFLNGRGEVANSLIPPGIFGHRQGEQGINPVVYQWQNGKPKRRSLETAKSLLAKAGYPQGRHAKTGEQLVLNYDVVSSGGPDDKARLAWYVKQLQKIHIQLNIRSTQYNRFRDKMQNGQGQIFTWGWHADYPDPENFLFLLYGPSGKVLFGGENATNYSNKQFDALYEQVQNMDNSAQRSKLIAKMIAISQEDAPMIWGFHPVNYVLSHSWNGASKPHEVAQNTMKYQSINVEQRAEKRLQWNKPVFWPLLLITALLFLLAMPLLISYWRQEQQPKVKRLQGAL